MINTFQEWTKYGFRTAWILDFVHCLMFQLICLHRSRTAISNAPTFTCNSPLFFPPLLWGEKDPVSKTLCYLPCFFKNKVQSQVVINVTYITICLYEQRTLPHIKTFKEKCPRRKTWSPWEQFVRKDVRWGKNSWKNSKEELWKDRNAWRGPLPVNPYKVILYSEADRDGQGWLSDDSHMRKNRQIERFGW